MKTKAKVTAKLQVISAVKAKHLIEKSGGKVFSAEWMSKQTGEIKSIVARTGVSKGVKGIGLKFDPKKKGLIVVWAFDRPKSECVDDLKYRFIWWRGLTRLNINGQRYLVKGGKLWA